MQCCGAWSTAGTASGRATAPWSMSGLERHLTTKAQRRHKELQSRDTHSSFPRSAWERQLSTLRVVGAAPLGPSSRDAERPQSHSHAERGNEIDEIEEA